MTEDKESKCALRGYVEIGYICPEIKEARRLAFEDVERKIVGIDIEKAKPYDLYMKLKEIKQMIAEEKGK